MKCTVTFTPTLKSTPTGQGHRVKGELIDGVLWVTSKPNPLIPAGRWGIHLTSRAIIVPDAEQPAAAPAKRGAKTVDVA